MPLTQRTLLLIVLAAAVTSAIAFGVVLPADDPEAAWLLAARYTARFAFLLFLVPFIAPAIPQFIGHREIRDTFLAFAAAHTIHLGALVTYRTIGRAPPGIDALIGGGLAYLLLFGLALYLLAGASPPRSQNYVFHYILLIFLLTYVGRIAEDATRIVGMLGTAACVVALLLRHGVPRLSAR